MFDSPEDQDLYRQQMAALLAKRDELAKLPVQRPGWVEVETDRTYGELWPAASAEERREMLQGRVAIEVRRSNDFTIHRDLERLLGEGPSGQEILGRLAGNT